MFSKKKEEKSLFSRLKEGLSKTRAVLNTDISDILLGKKAIDDELLEALETQLILADIGINASTKIMSQLMTQVKKNKLTDSEQLYSALKETLSELLQEVEKPLLIPPETRPFVILMVGVNGVGKTTTIGKLAKQFQNQGLSVLLAAGDTFRAAAVEQLQEWGRRNKVNVISQQANADPAAVIYDAIESAMAKKIDVVLADTAGRLHTQGHLMKELGKVKRVINKLDPKAPHETMLVVDATTGQNALNQAQQFNAIIPLTGITLTKLDGTAKGGILFAIAESLHLPIRYIGVGEKVDDLRVFNRDEFCNAIFDQPEEAHV